MENRSRLLNLALGAFAVLNLLLMSATLNAATHTQAAQVKQPNLLVIMGDDIGMWNIGAYHRVIDQPQGWLGEKLILTCHTSPTCVSIPSSVRDGPTTGRKMGPSSTSIGSSTNSGVSFSSSS